MRLKNYINETIKVVKDLRSNEVYPLLEKKCSKALSHFKKNREALWRGFKRYKGEHIIMDSSSGRSIHPNPYYYVMDQWKGFPKRSQSIICSTMYGDAKSYSRLGNLYMLFPFDGVKIAVAPDEDVWGSFEWFMPRYFMSSYGKLSSWEEIKKRLENLDKMRKEGEVNHEEVICRVFDTRDRELVKNITSSIH